ncbi:MAG: hypothetical protein M3354_08980 [Chloroflexota bacterium]|nr:hypothetical protein [Chloroflexota bacterium]
MTSRRQHRSQRSGEGAGLTAPDVAAIDVDVPAPDRSPTTRGGASPMTRRDFFAAVVDRLRRTLPDELRQFRHKSNMNLLKIDYGNERVHYEVWTDSLRQQIEIGLHFEDGPASTVAYLALFDAHIVEIKHQLGAEIELERWTPSWGHLFEIHPLARLDLRVAGTISQRLAAIIVATRPLIANAAIPPERSAQPAERRGPWRKWRR